MKSSIYIAAIILLLSCNSQQRKIGKYLYISKHATIHVDKDCEKISEIVFLDTTDLCYRVSYRFCPHCVDDSTYEEIKSIMTKEKYRKWLYQELINGGADMEYDVYMKRINDEDVRKEIYECAYGHCITDEYSTFCDKLVFAE